MHSQGRRHECDFRVRTPSKAGASTRLTQIRIVANTPLMRYRFQYVGADLRYSRPSVRAGLWYRHCRQIPRAYDVEGAYERWLHNI